MAKDNCAAGLRSFRLLNSRGQLSSETEILTPVLNPQEGIRQVHWVWELPPINQHWPGARATYCKTDADGHLKSQ